MGRKKSVIERFGQKVGKSMSSDRGYTPEWGFLFILGLATILAFLKLFHFFIPILSVEVKSFHFGTLF